jgi:hypothetical protein
MKTGIFRFAALGAIALVASFSFSSAASAKLKNCNAEYRIHYLKTGLHKAMATTGRRNPLGYSAMSCGTAWNYPTKRQAMKEALRQCRVSDRKFHDKGVCQIYAAR